VLVTEQLVIDQLMLNERGAPVYPKSILIDGEWVAGGTVRRMAFSQDRR